MAAMIRVGRTRALGELCGVICSQHDFGGVPDDLEELYGRMSATGAGVVKIAVTADDATDCLADPGFATCCTRLASIRATT